MLELYSGCCSHGYTIAREIEDKYDQKTTNGGTVKLPVHHITVDTEGSPTLKVNALSFTKENIQLLKDKFPNYTFIILASPPCTNYSCCNTTGAVTGDDLALSDSLVAIIELFQEVLGAVLTLVENPATGKLPKRQVISSWSYRYVFDYCRFGFLCRKRTIIFCNKSLTKHLYLPDDFPGANSCLCLGTTGM